MVGVALVGACAGPLAPTPPKVYRIGYFSDRTPTATADQIEAFRQAMRDLGYVEGRNLRLEIRWTEGEAERAPALAAELVALRPDVIAVRAAPGALAMKQATSGIPIVMVGTPDPMGNGLVASLARPGGNITGAAGPDPELAQRKLQLLTELVPGASRVAYLFDPANLNQARQYQEARSAATALGIELQPLEVRAPGDLAEAFAASTRGRPDAMFVGGGPLMASLRPRILDFLGVTRLPSITGGERDYVDGGALT